MVGSNLPPGADNDPRAPYNREPPMMETKAMAVTIDAEITVPEHADDDRESHEIKKAIDRGDYHLIDHETAEVLERRRG